jgi:hypothetical protein
MILASEALALPKAQLTENEVLAAQKLETELDEFIRENMKHSGCAFVTKETSSNVISAVNRRLKDAGYNTQWGQLVEKHKLNAAQQQVVGWQLMLAPSDEAYKAHRA